MVPTVDPAEPDLLARAREGSLSAFEEVVRRYQKRVYATAFRIVRRHDAADDVTQEAFLRAWRALDRFDPARPFGPWICRIAANLAINVVRGPRAREEGLPEGHAEAPAPDVGPLERVVAGEAHAALEEALSRLPADQRAVFLLRAVEEMTYEEIGEALGLPAGTVMSRLFRAREKLRALLAGHLPAGASPRRSAREAR
jgi:RNA polymerase sigma-70 factor (ECF subfamily)